MDLLLEKFGDLKDAEQVRSLLGLLKPYFLRRLKDDVEDSIPPLEETVVEVGLTKLQTVYYKGIYGENKYMLSKLGNNSAKAIHLNNMDIQLRKCCNHLYLLKGVEEELESKCSTEQEYVQSLLDSSGKLILLDKFIEKFRREQSKMLIFSQFKKMLEIVEIYLRHKGVPFEVLTGSVKNQDRVMSIQRFNDDPNFGAFLLTTRAGGLGINLTSARVVVIFDSDWNPQNDLQAIARAHRIGQTHEVKVYRFITKKTYEEQMFNRASKKLGMEQALFKASKDIDIGDSTDLKPDQKEIENLLRYGAYAFIDNDGDDVKNMSIDDILTKKEKGKSKKGKSLSKSTFNVDEYEKKLDKLNDDDFWKTILPSLDTVSVQALEKKLKFDRAEIVKSEDAQREFLSNLQKLKDQLLEQKGNSADIFSTEDDETRLRDLMMKFCKVHKMNPEVREEAKKCLRDLNQSIEVLSYEAKFKEEKSQNEQSKTEKEDNEDKSNDDILMDEGKIRSKQRVRRKRKVNKDVVYDQDNVNDEYDEKSGSKASRKKQKQSSDADEYIVEPSEKQFMGKSSQGEKNDEDYSEVVHADTNADDDMKGDSELAKDNVPTYEMNMSVEDRTDPLYAIAPGSDSSSKDESVRRREMKRMQKYAPNEFSMPKVMPYNNHQMYAEPFPVFCAECYYKVDTAQMSWICRGHCGKVYHDRCKRNFENNPQNRGQFQGSEPREWICWVCREGRAECFICKKVDSVKPNPKKPLPSYVISQSNPSASDYSYSQYLGQSDSHNQRPKKDDIYQHIAQDEDWKYKNQEKKPNEDQPKKNEESKTPDIKFEFDSQPTFSVRQVVKCYTGSCMRFYHIDCLINSKHRSLFNSQKKDEFKCSLHFCKLCGATSEQSLLMQCLKCPTSFHMKCSKVDVMLQKLSRRHMICGSHYQDNASDDSDRKEDAIENHSKYHSSDLVEQENPIDEDVIISSSDKKKLKQAEQKPTEDDVKPDSE